VSAIGLISGGREASGGLPKCAKNGQASNLFNPAACRICDYSIHNAGRTYHRHCLARPETPLQLEEYSVKETTLSSAPDAKSPAGADIRFIMDGATGNMIHSTVPPRQINRATIHATVSEFWYVLEGAGEIWRRDETEERVTALVPGVSVDIPVGTAFQYRNVGDTHLQVHLHLNASLAGGPRSVASDWCVGAFHIERWHPTYVLFLDT